MSENGRACVYVVEDDDDIRDSLLEILRESGYVAEGFGDARLALARLRTASPLPGIILLDLTMPRLDGKSFCVELAADPRIAGIAVVLLSARVDAPETARLLKVAGHLAKPVAFAELLKTVAKYCDGTA